MESTDTNFKNQLLSWAQRNNKVLTFETIDEKLEGTRKLFVVGIMLDGEFVVSGSGFNKKEAGQVAARNALEMLNVKG
jgi:ribonuclease-3